MAVVTVSLRCGGGLLPRTTLQQPAAMLLRSLPLPTVSYRSAAIQASGGSCKVNRSVPYGITGNTVNTRNTVRQSVDTLLLQAKKQCAVSQQPGGKSCPYSSVKVRISPYCRHQPPCRARPAVRRHPAARCRFFTTWRFRRCSAFW